MDCCVVGGVGILSFFCILIGIAIGYCLKN